MYDEEVGYCQGLSFLSAVLLLHVSKTNESFLFILFFIFHTFISLPFPLIVLVYLTAVMFFTFYLIVFSFQRSKPLHCW